MNSDTRQDHNLMAKLLTCTVLLILGNAAVPGILRAQYDEEKKVLLEEYTSLTNQKLHPFPEYEDSLIISDNKYHLKGIKGVDEADLSLSIQVGVEEERVISRARRIFYGLGNLVVRIATLTFWDLKAGDNRLYFDSEVFFTDLKRIEKYYERKGFHDARVDSFYIAVNPKNRRISDIRIFVTEGKPTVLIQDPIVDVVDYYDLDYDKERLEIGRLVKKLQIKKKDVFAEELVKQGSDALKREFAINGYPNAKVAAKVDQITEYDVALTFEVSAGNRAVFGDVTVAGNKKPDGNRSIVSEKVIRRQLRFKSGEWFDPEKLGISVSRIYGLGVFRSVRPKTGFATAPIDSSDTLAIAIDTVDVTLNVSWKAPRLFKPGIGFTNDFRDLPDETTTGQKIKSLAFTTFQGSWQSRNWFGGGRKLSFSVVLSRGYTSVFPAKHPIPFRYSLVKLSFKQPALYIPIIRDVESDLSVDVSAERDFNKATDALKYKAEPTFNRLLAKHLVLSYSPFSYNREESILQGLTNVAGKDSSTAETYTNMKVGLSYNNTTDFFYPTDGFLISLTTDLAGVILPSNVNYLRIALDNRKYLGVTRKVSLAARARIGTIVPLKGADNTNIPITERFFAGGPNSVRGWAIRELGPVRAQGTDSTIAINFVGGSSIVEAGIELRYNIYKTSPEEVIQGMDFVSFFDVGNVWEKDDFKTADFSRNLKMAFGAGLRIRTVVGPIRVDFGFKISDNDPALGDSGNAIDLDKEVRRFSAGKPNILSNWNFHLTLGQSF